MPRAASAVLPLESNVVFASHHWPTFGNSKVLTFLSQQRDLYAYLHNETLRQLNAGKTGLEIVEDFKVPDSLENLWCSREYYGSVSHNVKAIYSRYMGWFDGNPAHLWEHPPVEAAQRYVNCMGGIEKVIELGVKYREAGELRFAATLLNHAVFSDQSNSTATQELSTTYKDTWLRSRKCHLAQLLSHRGSRTDRWDHQSFEPMSPESYSALSMEQLMDTIAIRINGPAASEACFTIDVMITDRCDDYRQKRRIPHEYEQQHRKHFPLLGQVLRVPTRYSSYKFPAEQVLTNIACNRHSIAYQKAHLIPNTPASLTVWPTFQQFVDLVDGQRQDLSGIETSGDLTVWDTLNSLLTSCDTGFAIVGPEEP